MTPAQTVFAAMPGTLSELAARTGYPIRNVLVFIRQLRQEGFDIRVQLDPGGSPSSIVFNMDGQGEPATCEPQCKVKGHHDH